MFAMNEDRWQRVKDIFEDALEYPADERAKLVASKCAGDLALQAEVEKLLVGDACANSFLESPAIGKLAGLPEVSAYPSLSPEDLISNRFKIVRFLGAGGMGQVYEALDLELQERIALKAIHPGIASDQRIVLRFKQELQLTRRITHPNICRTFHFERYTPSVELPVGARREITFLTMELLEGETLAAFLERRRFLGVEEAFPIAQQMGRALGAAHNVGIIHRDLKPSNVMLVRSESGLRVVVTDFGLARAVLPQTGLSAEEIASSLTATGQPMGTLAYMAPEQLEKGEATVATDIYALGLILYEMVAGRRPFGADRPFAEIIRRLKENPPSPRAYSPKLSESWEVAIEGCLKMAPEARFSSAEEVIQALQNPVELNARNAKDRSKPLRRAISETGKRNYRRRAWLAGILGVVVVALLGGIFRLYQWESKSARVPEGAGLFLTEISNQSGDSELDAVTEILRGQLSQSSYTNLMETPRVQEILSRMAHPVTEKLDPAAAREVAMRDGAPLVLFGTASRIAEDFKLDLKLEKVGSEPSHARSSWTFDEVASSKKEFLEVIHHGGIWVRRVAGEAESNIETTDRRPEDVTTDNWEALSLYSKGQERAASGRSADAVLLFKEAVEKDPKFAMGWMRIGDILDTLGETGQGLSDWKKALEVTGDRRLSLREELRIKGMYASDSGDLPAAVEYFGQYSIAYPNDHLGYFYRGYPLMLLGRTEEAVATLKEAEKRAPHVFEIADHLARYYLILGDDLNMSRYIGRVRELGHPENADLLEGERLVFQGQDERARDLFKRLRNSGDAYLRSVSYELEASALAEQGLYREAIDVLNEGAKSDLPAGDSADRADKYLSLAYLYLKRADREESRTSALKSLAVAYSPERAAEAGSILSRAGWVADAKKLLAELALISKTAVVEVSRLRLSGEILLAEGQLAKALSELRKARELDWKRALLRDYWVRALIANRRWDEAQHELGQLAERSGQVWHQAELYFPGANTDLLFLRARVSLELGRADAKKLIGEYSDIRRNADPGLQQTKELIGVLRSRSKITPKRGKQHDK
jgi:eukaryotic-like serine/threonine-protein kinase